jgi:hypothetical protein
MTGEVSVGRDLSGPRIVTLPARPEPIRVSADETAIVVIDMQNAYASPGGYVDQAGFDIAGSAGTIGKIAAVLDTARAAGMPVIRLACVTYTVTGAAAVPPFQLLRAVGTAAGVPIVDGIETLQLAYGVDANNDGRIDDQAGGTLGTVDCKDFVPNNTANNGQCAGAAGSVPGIPIPVNSTPTATRQVRITVVGRQMPPAGFDPTFRGSSAVIAEDHALADLPGAAAVGNVRRRVLTRIVSLRNTSPL